MSTTMTETTSKGRLVTGTVVSDKMDKTIVIKVERTVPHLKYKKSMKKTTKLYAHDETNSCKIGDTVKIKETRPRSKTKTWEVIEVVSSGSK